MFQISRQVLSFLIVSFTLLRLTSLDSYGQEWTRFRGPNGSGVSHSQAIPAKWTEDDYNWKVKLPGYGHGSPVLWGDKIFLNCGTNEDATRHVVCLSSKDGKIVWDKPIKSTNHHLHRKNSYGSGTPALDKNHVYVAWATADKYILMALTHDGKTVWTRDLGEFSSQHGFGTSPIVYNSMVIIANEQKGPSFLIALDCKNGKTIWKTTRPFRRTAYSMPCIYQPKNGDKQLIFVSGKNGFTGVNPMDGKVLWENPVFDKRTVSSPIIVNDMILGTCGSGGGGNYLVAVKPPTAKSKKKTAQELYRFKKSAPYVPTPVANGNLVFLFNDRGVVSCIDAKTGRIHFNRRLRGNFSGSPVLVNHRIYCISEAGMVFVIAADKKYKLISTHDLKESSFATPAIANGCMYLRTNYHLISIGGKKD